MENFLVASPYRAGIKIKLNTITNFVHYLYYRELVIHAIAHYIVVTCRVEQYFNTVIIFDYELQEPLHFGSTVKTEPCENYCNLKQTHYNYVVFLRSLTESFLSTELDIIDSLNLSHC